MSDTIDLTPTPLEAVRVVRVILQNAYNLPKLQYGATDRQILKAWHRYEEALIALGIVARDGSKALHRELLRHCLTVELATKDLEPGLTEATTWDELNA